MWKYHFLSSIQESQSLCVFWSVIMAEQVSLAQMPKQNRRRSVLSDLSLQIRKQQDCLSLILKTFFTDHAEHNQ